MLTLAIETSGLAGSVALFDGIECLAAKSLQLGVRHGQSLIPELGNLLASQGKSPRDCELLAVSTGPGSFTGLRVGVVCAKTWAYATGCRLVAVDTHLAIACNSPAGIRSVQVVSEAQRGDVFFSRLQQDATGRWAPVLSLRYLPADEWVASLNPGDVVTGPGLTKLEPRLAGICRILDRACWVAQAAMVARIGTELARAGAWTDPWSLEPAYLRPSSAEEKWDLLARR